MGADFHKYNGIFSFYFKKYTIVSSYIYASALVSSSEILCNPSKNFYAVRFACYVSELRNLSIFSAELNGP